MSPHSSRHKSSICLSEIIKVSFDLLYEGPDWLPEPLWFNDYGNYKDYEQAVFDTYQMELVRNHPLFEGKPVLPLSCKFINGRPALFDHIIYGKGKHAIDKEDFRRLERVAWIRSIITHSDDSRVKVWTDMASGTERVSLWLDEEYMVVLEPKKDAWRLVTAFCTDIPWMRKSYNKRYAKALALKKSEIVTTDCNDLGNSSCDMAGEHREL